MFYIYYVENHYLDDTSRLYSIIKPDVVILRGKHAF
jgi:hypothetical protein